MFELKQKSLILKLGKPTGKSNVMYCPFKTDITVNYLFYLIQAYQNTPLL